MPLDVDKVLVVVPTYFEAGNIEAVLTGIRAELPRADVLVIDDGSTDGTVEKVHELAARDPHIGIVERHEKAGLGDAYRTGFRIGLERGYELLVEMDADLSHDAAYLPELVSAAHLGADLAIGSRYVPGGGVEGWPRRRLWLSRWGNRYAAFALGLAVNDATAGYRAYRADALRRIELSTVTADGFSFQIEMTYRAIRARMRIVEIPIVFRDRVDGASKMSRSIVVEALRWVTARGLSDLFSMQRFRRAYERTVRTRSHG